MERNVGGYDRIARSVVGPVLIVVGAATLLGFLTLAGGTVGTVLAVLALVVGTVLTVTAVTQKCPLNDVLGMNTYRADADRSSSEEGEASAR